MDPEALVAVGADAVLGNGEKAEVPEALEAATRRQEDPGDRKGAQSLSVTAFPGRARAFLKVQDGCDCSCAYCIVPHARGASRSVPLPDVEKGLLRLRQSGHREVVLTGVHLGSWGRDLEPARPFDELLDAAEASRIPRVRLSSLEPGELTSEVIRRLRASAVLCPHLHVPLQSGSDRVLRAMGRPYTAAGFRERAEEALREVPGLCLGFDVIAGFPGEGEREFGETRDLLGDLPFAYLHVFPFSARQGTRAASLPGRVPEPEVRRRAALLRALSRERRNAFERAQLGREARTLAEGPPEDGILRVRTRNYVEVRIPWRGPAPAEEMTVLLERMSGGGVSGRPVGPASEGGG
jgi:threonylcarbamoyladenosine tRNA methylthiotransferase MtaB